MRVHEYASQSGHETAKVVALVKERTGDQEVTHLSSLDDATIEMLDATLGVKPKGGEGSGEGDGSDLFDGIEPVKKAGQENATAVLPAPPAPPIPRYPFAVTATKKGDLGTYEAVDEPDAIAQAVKRYGLKAHQHQFRAVKVA